MEKITYPILYYELNERATLGLLVGTDYQLVEKDISTLKTGLHNYVNQQYKKFDDYWIVNILEPKLKVLEILFDQPIKPSKVGIQ